MSTTETMQETETAEINTHDGDLAALEAACDGEEGSVAAEDEHEVHRGCGEVLAVGVDAGDRRPLRDPRAPLFEGACDRGLGGVGDDVHPFHGRDSKGREENAEI